MSYTVLARRYRSTDFDELVGQQHIAQTLSKAITSNRLAHAFLFCGTRGTGKTSSARILAKCLNCEASDKPTPKPCGKCNSCLAIAKGEDIDVIEIDAASNTGVDNVREIIENAQFRPARSRFKVYIIDEVHMLSKSAFNALLKTLEEPPEHVKFILATTEAEKVLPTILSRCQRYDFRNIPTREICEHLRSICKKEKIKADDDALLLVAKAGAGSMRDALSLLDRLLSVGEGHLSIDLIEQMLGMPKSQLVFDIAQTIGSGDVQKTLEQTDKLITSGLSVDTLSNALIDHFRNLLILRTCGTASQLVEVPGLPLEDLNKQAQQFDPIVLTQNIIILEELRRQLRTSAAGRALVDATFVRLALAEQFSSVADLLDAASGGASIQKKKFEFANVTPEALNRFGDSGEDVGKYITIAPPADEPTINDTNDDLPSVGKVWEGAGPTSVFAAFKKSTANHPKPVIQELNNIEPVHSGEFGALMQQLRTLAHEESPTITGFLEGGMIRSTDDNVVTIAYPDNLSMSAKMLERNGKKESLQALLGKILGNEIGVKFEILPPDSNPTPNPSAVPFNPPPAQRSVVKEAEPPPANFGIVITDDLRGEIMQNNPLIKTLAEAFGARIVKVEEE